MCQAGALLGQYGLVVGVQKLHEYEALKNNRRRSQVLSCSKLVACYDMNKDQL